mmetsp:Transcript_85856/g.199584  ORF Transcript_85856/g.199584 Transcript_85856/m.199584 type:complete len:209 (+) Transcript_85856:227-853(+)
MTAKLVFLNGRARLIAHHDAKVIVTKLVSTNHAFRLVPQSDSRPVMPVELVVFHNGLRNMADQNPVAVISVQHVCFHQWCGLVLDNDGCSLPTAFAGDSSTQRQDGCLVSSSGCFRPCFCCRSSHLLCHCSGCCRCSLDGCYRLVSSNCLGRGTQRRDLRVNAPLSRSVATVLAVGTQAIFQQLWMGSAAYHDTKTKVGLDGISDHSA